MSESEQSQQSFSTVIDIKKQIKEGLKNNKVVNDSLINIIRKYNYADVNELNKLSMKFTKYPRKNKKT